MEIPLGEVVGSHYAFPIFGVILCALLVFAFGFKSPSQPPSFDDMDSDKKVSSRKRRQVKESKKTKSQQLNGHCPTPLSKVVPAVQAKLKRDKVAKSKNCQTKSLEIKKGPQEKPSSTKVKKESVKVLDQNTGTIMVQQEDNDGDWVQLLSKKEKKVRRKGEEKDCTGDAGKRVEKRTCRKRGMRSWKSSLRSQAIVQWESNMVTGWYYGTGVLPGFTTVSNGRRGLKMRLLMPSLGHYFHRIQNCLDAGAESPKAIPLKCKQQQQQQANKEAAPQPTQETSDPEEHPKDQRNKKKDKTPPSPPEPIKSTKKEKREEESGGAKPTGKLEKRCAEEVSSEASCLKVLAKEDHEASQKTDDLVTPGKSNVAFDELGDAWQEAKPLKKKKARKD